MPRGPHRRTDESPLAGSDYLARIAELPEVWTPSDLFSKRQPLEVEIGSGKGLFIASASVAHPSRNFIGIELIKKYAAMCALRIQRLRVENARMLEGDGTKLFRTRIGDDSLAAVHVYFPDPWWKQRHRKRRV